MIHVRVKVIVGAGLLLGLAAIAITLSRSPIAVAGVNTSQEAPIGEPQPGSTYCQPHEVLPRDISAIRLRSYAFLGPRVTLTVSARGRLVARGERGSGWTGGVVTIPVKRLSTVRSGLDLCFTFFTNGDESVGLFGESTAGALAARGPSGSLPGRVRVEYLRASGSSWWSLAPEVARRMGLGHAPSGTWSVLLAVALMVGVCGLCARVILRELG
ncbi:MAG TPA: hypothetical protein VK680_03515 [Solirubrobacteraceae bacterium]|nr:hypothetical protein [Solirubrobacteraceae bacterium]